ncbi:MAG: FHA domain-containing protein [Solirubrobacteraceae bacterium]
MADEWLEVTGGPAAGTRLEVGRELAVGRAEPGPAGLAGDRLLSRAHARFWRAAGGELIVEDLGSANGTYLGGERLDRPAVLAVGDEVQLAATTIVVRAAQPTAARSPPPQPTRIRSGPQPAPGLVGPQLGGQGRPAVGRPERTRSTSSRLLRPRPVVVALLIVAVAGIGVALATSGGGANAGVIAGSAVVDPLFPVTGFSFHGRVASVESKSARGPLSATIDWGDGTTPVGGTIGRPVASGNAVYTRTVSGTHTYTRAATYDVTVNITAGKAESDSASNLAVVTSCACVAKLPAFGHSVDLGPVSGNVFVKVPGDASFVALITPREVPVGTQLDATRGSLVLTASGKVRGQVFAGEFDGGQFQILQTQTLGNLVDLKLDGASTAACVSGNTSQVLALLHASVNGDFRTQGRYSAATVRGTEWTTTEQCDGTLTRVRRGLVDVQDFRTGATIALAAGESYLAKAR